MTEHQNHDPLSDLFRSDGFAGSLGVELSDWSGGSATVIATPGPEHLNFTGSVHGGFLFSCADVAVSVASNSWGRKSVAVSIDIEYLSGARAGDELTVTADEVGRGRNMATYRVDIRGRNKLLSVATAVTFRTGDWHFGADAWSEDWRAAH